MEYKRRTNFQKELTRKQEDWQAVHEQLLGIQKKAVEISHPDDPDEKEADRVAEKVVSGETAEVGTQSHALHRKENTPAINAGTENQLSAHKGPGQSLDAETLGEMESKMGADFTDVKIHTGSEADAMNKALDAKAFTFQKDIFFANGNFDTSSPEGKTLLAHELTHTIQQDQTRIRRKVTDEENEVVANPEVTIESGKLNVMVKDGENTYTKTPQIDIAACRKDLIDKYTWNGIVKVMKFVYSAYKSTYSTTTIAGTAADDSIIVPDQGIAYIARYQGEKAIENYKTDIAKNNTVILAAITGKINDAFLGYMGYTGSNLSLQLDNEANNTTTTDPDNPNQQIATLDATTSEDAKYDILRKLVIARNGLWSDNEKVINLAAIRRSYTKTGTKKGKNGEADVSYTGPVYDDTLFVCWKEPQANAPAGQTPTLVKRAKSFMLTTQAGNYPDDPGRSIGINTVTVYIGTHKNSMPAMRTQKELMIQQDQSLKFETDDKGINFHPGGTYAGMSAHNFGTGKQDTYTDKPLMDVSASGKTDAAFKQDLLVGKMFGILMRWQLYDEGVAYDYLCDVAKGRYAVLSKDATGITIQRGTDANDQKVISYADARAAATTNRADLEKILLSTDPNYTLPPKNASAEELRKSVTDSHIESIVGQQLRYYLDKNDIDGIASSTYITDIINKGRTEITDDLVNAAVTDKNYFDLLETEAGNDAILSSTKKGQTRSVVDYAKQIKGTLKNEKDFYKETTTKGKIDVGNNFKGANENAANWSTACQVVYGSGAYYTFWMTVTQFISGTTGGADSLQRRWYYTIIDSSSLNAATQTNQGETQSPATNQSPTNTNQAPANTNQNTTNSNELHSPGTDEVNPEIQRKAEPGENPGLSDSNDRQEKEADLVAKQVANNENADLSRLSGSAETGENKMTLPEGFSQQLKATSGKGRPIADEIKNEMENRMGVDFSGVNIHTGTDADQLSQDINANAFTHGNDIYFSEGKYDPESAQGKELLAHELTHTVQQNGGSLQRKIARQENKGIPTSMKGGDYTVIAGDNPSVIAKKVYGSQAYVDYVTPYFTKKTRPKDVLSLPMVRVVGTATDYKSYGISLDLLKLGEGGGTPQATPSAPSSNSGVTIGFGYDMKLRTQDSVEKDLKAAGVPQTYIDDVKSAAGLASPETDKWITKYVSADPAKWDNYQNQQAVTSGLNNLLENVSFPENVNSMIHRIDTFERNYQKKLTGTLPGDSKIPFDSLDAIILDILSDLMYGGQMTATTWAIIREPVLKNDIGAFLTVMLDERLIASVGTEGKLYKRFNQRIAHMVNRQINRLNDNLSKSGKKLSADESKFITDLQALLVTPVVKGKEQNVTETRTLQKDMPEKQKQLTALLEKYKA